MNHEKFQDLIKQLYATVNDLERMFPGRHFDVGMVLMDTF
jgi:hypothetical protein